MTLCYNHSAAQISAGCCRNTHRSTIVVSASKLAMAVAILAVDGKVVNNLGKAINSCADRGLQVAINRYAYRTFPFPLPRHTAVIGSTHVLTPRSEGRRASHTHFSRQALCQPTRSIIYVINACVGHDLSSSSSPAALSVSLPLIHTPRSPMP